MSSEKSVDQAFCRLVKTEGGLTIKLSTLGAYGSSGWPDRLVLLNGIACFVELKAPGKRSYVSRLQARRMDELTDHGFRCTVADNAQDALAFVRDVCGAV